MEAVCFIQRDCAAGLSSRLRISDNSFASSSQAQFSTQRRHRSLTIRNVGWDPEGILASPVGGHIARRRSQKSLAETEREQAIMEQMRQAKREARIVPETDEDLVNFFLETEAEEIKFEVARCRPRLTENFFSALKSEIGKLKFIPSPTADDTKKVAQLEILEKSILAEKESYDTMAQEFFSRKEILEGILKSKDKKAHLLELSSQGKLDPPLLALLDHNIATAEASSQEQVVQFLKKLRGGVAKYMTF